jgi:hypothetical protein
MEQRGPLSPKILGTTRLEKSGCGTIKILSERTEENEENPQ